MEWKGDIELALNEVLHSKHIKDEVLHSKPLIDEVLCSETIVDEILPSKPATLDTEILKNILEFATTYVIIMMN